MTTVPRRHGITFPFDGLPLHAQRDHVRALVDAGYTDLWSAESGAHDAFTPLVLASSWAPELRLGTAIVPAYTRGPATLAEQVASICDAAPGRFALGLGTSSDVIVGRWNGIPFEKPYQRVRDTVRFLRSALTGEKVTHEYETFAVDGFRLGVKIEQQPPILVAALRDGMLRLAGREGDGAIINWLSPDDVRTVAPYVGPDKEIVARIFVLPLDDRDTVMSIGKRAIASYLTVPVYAAFHRWLGRGDLLERTWELWAAGDRKEAAAAIPDEVVDDLLVWGTPERCHERVEAYAENGVTTTAPAIFAGPEQVLDVARALAPR